jgi:putative oxidoreductase
MSNSVVLLIARVLLSVMFIMAGFSKFGGIAGTAGYIGSVGLPAPTLLAWLSGIWEVVAGIAVLIGFQTRIAALALALFCILTAVFFHTDFSDQMQMTIFMKNFTLVGGFLALFVAGPGSLSVDGRRGSA